MIPLCPLRLEELSELLGMRGMGRVERFVWFVDGRRVASKRARIARPR